MSHTYFSESEEKQRKIIEHAIFLRNKKKFSDPDAKKTYYKEKYGLWFKKIVEEIEAGKEHKKILASDERCKPITLYLKCVQAREYMIDHLDPEGRVQLLLRKIKLHRCDEGVIFQYFDAIKPETSILHPTDPNDVMDAERSVKDLIIEYLETQGSAEPLVIRDVVLEPDEWEELEQMLAPLSGITYIFKPHEIKIVKLK